MDLSVKENGIGEPLLSNFSNQHNQSKKNRTPIHHCNSAPAFTSNQPNKEPNNLPSESLFKTQSSCPTLTQAGVILIIYLGVGMICFYTVRHELKGLKTSSLVDALYFCIVTMTTLGYGDLVPHGVLAKIFACVFVFGGMTLVGLLLSCAADYLVEKQEKLLIKAFHAHHTHGLDKFANECQTHKAKWKLLISFTILLALIVVGVVVLHEVEGLDFLNSFYCVCSTITTLGYGDQSFSTEGGRIFAVVWILVSTVCLAQFFLYLAEATTEGRQHSLVHWVLTRKTTITDLEAADMNSDGVVSAAEFVIYKLKEMGKIGEEDVALVLKEFEHLDADHSGSLTVSDLKIAQQGLEN